jgi:hypothetical protein
MVHFVVLTHVMLAALFALSGPFTVLEYICLRNMPVVPPNSSGLGS